MSSIKDKKTFYKLYERGAFGNKFRTWDNIFAFYGDCDLGWKGNVSMRYKGVAGGGKFRYNVPEKEVPSVIIEWIKDGADQDLVALNEGAPDTEMIWQGELMNTDSGWYLRYSRDKANMREALKNSQHLHGLSVLLLMKQTLTPSSYEDVMAIFEEYPDSVVELSVFNRVRGIIPGRNAIVWEVRNF